jgi:hypothetical protein
LDAGGGTPQQSTKRIDRQRLVFSCRDTICNSGRVQHRHDRVAPQGAIATVADMLTPTRMRSERRAPADRAIALRRDKRRQLQSTGARRRPENSLAGTDRGVLVHADGEVARVCS